MKILFFGKANDEFAGKAFDLLKSYFPEATGYFGSRHDPFPVLAEDWNGDYILSYLSPWIIPGKLLEKTKYGGINWHPAPPEYPGIGCTNFAIYNDESEYGITCHFMNPRVDSGNIIEVIKFPVSKEDTVWSLTQKCYRAISDSFVKIIKLISEENSLPKSNEQWKRKPYTRKELDALCVITPDMDESEVERRIKATTYDKPWAYTMIHGHRFYFREE